MIYINFKRIRLWSQNFCLGRELIFEKKNIVSEYDLHFIILVLENIKLFTDPQQIMLAPVGTLNNVRILIFMQF